MRSHRITAVLVTTALAVAACGGDDTDEAGADAAVGEAPDAAPADDSDSDDMAAETDDEVQEPAEAQEPAAAPTGGGSGTATLTLANGDSFEFSVLCSLEPQMAAGSEILFTATSYDDIGLDITQFGDEGTVTDIASISVYDAAYATLWDAGSVYEGFGGSIDLSLDGSTITGSASFYPAGDPAAEPVDGEVVANC